MAVKDSLEPCGVCSHGFKTVYHAGACPEPSIFLPISPAVGKAPCDKLWVAAARVRGSDNKWKLVVDYQWGPTSPKPERYWNEIPGASRWKGSVDMGGLGYPE